VNAWRCWRLEDGELRPPFYLVSMPIPWQDGVNTATCTSQQPDPDRRYHHVAPEPDHVCGLFVVRDLDQLLAYLRRRLFATRVLVVAEVAYWGRVLPSNVWGDPPGTLRVQHAKRVGELQRFVRRPEGPKLVAMDPSLTSGYAAARPLVEAARTGSPVDAGGPVASRA